MTERNTHFDNRSFEIRTEAPKPAPEAVGSISVPPADIVRLAKAGLEWVAAHNPSVDPSKHVSPDNWYGHKRIKPSVNQMKNQNP